MSYKCIRCGYSTEHKGTFIRHIERTNRCKNKFGNFSKNEIYEKNGMEMKITKLPYNDKPADKPAKPAYKNDKPADKPAKPEAKPEAKPAKPEAKPDKPDKPEAKPETKLKAKLHKNISDILIDTKTKIETYSEEKIEKNSDEKINSRETTKNDFKIIKEKKINVKTSKNTYDCKYCGKSFKHYQSRYKHEKYRCPKREIKPKKKKVQVDGSILPYNDTNKQFLTDEMIKKCMEKQNRCVPEMIKLVHFNNKHPENMNLCISNLKNDYVMVFDGEEWIVKNRDDMFDKLISDSEKILQSKFMKWFDDAKEDDKYNKAVEKFKKYLNKSSNQTLINNIKKELKLLLYNTRNKKKNPLKDCIITEVYT